MAGTFRSVHLDDLAEVWAEEAGGVNWRPVRHQLGIEAFGIGAFSANAGELLSELHDELAADEAEGIDQEELYLVVRGAARFTVAGEAVDAPAGTLVFLPDPAVMREATASEDNTLLLVVGGSGTEAFRKSRWEQAAVLKHGIPQLP